MSQLIHYIFVRKDLPLGVLAAMVTHAAGESAAHSSIHYDESRVEEGTTAIVLEAYDEAHLRRIRDFIGKEGFDYDSIVESSAPYENQLMAIGLWPEERTYFGDQLKKFQLLKTCLDIPPVARLQSKDSTHDIENTSEGTPVAS